MFEVINQMFAITKPFIDCKLFIRSYSLSLFMSSAAEFKKAFIKLLEPEGLI